MYGDGYNLDLLRGSLCNIYKHQTYIAYLPEINNVVCQLYLNFLKIVERNESFYLHLKCVHM